MSSKPWEPDRLLTLAAARSAIRARFPDIDVRGLQHLGSGWEFDAYLTSDGWVFRFPRRAYAAELFERERRVHTVVASSLPSTVAVPRVELIASPTDEFPYRFAGHRLVAGLAVDQVDQQLLPTLARDLGAALGALHAMPESTARAAGIGDVDIEDREQKEWFDRGLALASELAGLDPVVEDAARWMREVSLPPARYAGPRHVIHNDLAPEHLIVDPTSGRLAGIIDWTDADFGDPVRDFVVLPPALGWSVAERVLASYPLALDHGFRERLRLLARVLSVMWLSEAHEQGGDVAKHIKWVRNAFAR